MRRTGGEVHFIVCAHTTKTRIAQNRARVLCRLILYTAVLCVCRALNATANQLDVHTHKHISQNAQHKTYEFRDAAHTVVIVFN